MTSNESGTTSKYEPCPGCRGSGENAHGEDVCPRCAGKGEIPTPPGWTEVN